ncbi:MAG: SMP-30/gluconolactonase/LRE family protein [Candidatus Hydrogenedentota bacterium]
MVLSALIGLGVLLSADSLLDGKIQLIQDGYQFADGPLWLPDEEKWIFSDVLADTLYDSNNEHHLKPSKNINGLNLDAQKRVVACQSQTHSIVRLERNGKTTALASHFADKPLNATNDLVVRSDGVIFFTDPIPAEKGFESALGYSGVYALWPEQGKIKLLTKELRYPNGIGLSPDEKTLYVSDTCDTAIWAYTLDTDDSISAMKKLCTVELPDGLAVDDDGHIWSTTSTGITIFSNKGERLESVTTSMMPTNCAFGGPNNSTLLITARKRVFRIETRVHGLGAYHQKRK